MATKEKTIKVLQALISELMSGKQQHYMHAVINKKKGFVKLADRMLQEHTEETEATARFVNRLLELGGTPDLKAYDMEVFTNVEEQLKKELEEQKEAMEALNKMFNEIQGDTITEQLLYGYIAEENEHLSWLQQQVDLMDTIGLQNYLSTQI